MSKDFQDAVKRYGSKGKPEGWKPEILDKRKCIICKKELLEERTQDKILSYCSDSKCENFGKTIKITFI